MSKKVGRIRDVAKETGLSIATISRVMNGTKNVSPATRDRVLEACRKLDYVPNPAARALSTRSSRTVAAIIPTIEHSVYAKFVAAIEQTLSEAGYSLVMAISNWGQEEELACVQKLLGMGAQAFILSGTAHSQELTDLLDRRRVPYIFTSVWDPSAPAPTIGYDNFDLAAQAVRYLADKGHRHITAIHGPLDESDRTRARRAGAESMRGLVDHLDFYETPVEVAGGKRVLKQLAQTPSATTAVLCFSDVLALGCYFGAQETGIRIPDDLSIMGFDNLDWSADTVPGLTTINLPSRRMGRIAAEQLVAHLQDDTPIEPVLIDGQIVERQSVGTLKRR